MKSIHRCLYKRIPILTYQDHNTEGIYELVPEGYRKHYRSSQSKKSQTYTKFAREKRYNLIGGVQQKIAQDNNRLHQLILLEEFKSYLPP